jgi:eukaryotic-like serine/threonine-protein kinase
MHRPTVSYQFDDVTLDPEAFSVQKSGRVVALEPKSIRLLLYLIQNRARAVSKDELLRSVWEDAAVTENALTRVVAQLRKALGDDVRVARYIETVPTIGYRFVAEVMERAAPAYSPAVPPAPAPGRNHWILTAALAGALIAGAAVYLFREPPATPQAPLWSGTVLGGSRIASHPRISPDGQLLAFRAIIDGQSQVAVMKPDSSSWTALTHDRGNGAVASLAWSRDGSKIYFDREWGPGRIYSIGALGGEPRLILENAWIPEPLPDGSLIAQRPSSEGHYQLLRFWPETGRTQVLPGTVIHNDAPDARVFPDGREIAVYGIPGNAIGPPRLFVLNLQTLATRDIGPKLAAGETLRQPLAVSGDGAVLIQRRREDIVDTIAVPRSGSAPPRTLLSLPFSVAPISMDVAPDGSLYMDHSGFQRSILNLTPSGTLRTEIPVPEVVEHNRGRSVIGVPDGGFIFSVPRHGRPELFLASNGAEPQLLLNSAESADLPGAFLAGGRLAFITDSGVQPHIAIASLQDGRVIQRFPADAHWVTAISAPADGQTIYYASGGIVWAQAVAAGDPRKVGEGSDLAVDPAGKFLYVARAEAEGFQLYRMPAAGGEATRVNLPGRFTLAPDPLWSSAVDRQGRILLKVNVPDVFFYQAALFDPARNTMTLVPVPPRVVVSSAGWTPDGDIWAVASRWSASLWHYRISLQNKAR